MRRTIRPIRRKERLNELLAGAGNPLERVQIALDHYRSGLKVQPDPAGAERVVEFLVEEGDRLYAKKEGGARRGDGQ